MQGALLSFLDYLEPALCAVALICIFFSASARKFVFLTLFLVNHLGSLLICFVCVHVPASKQLGHVAYRLYFATYWTSYGLESVLSLLVIYGIYRLAMVPLQGLQRLGTLVFRWAGAISIALALAVACNSASTGISLINCLSQLQQTSSVLTLCLMLFVCFAIRPMGLSYGSRIFGVSFGMGLVAAVSLVDSAWIAHSPNLQSSLSIANGISTCVALVLWSAYFGLPEQKQRILVIPTTSPFLRWNQISEALGDEPGVVAIGGLSPDVFAPAELEMMFRASAKMTALEGDALPTDQAQPIESLIA